MRCTGERAAFEPEEVSRQTLAGTSVVAFVCALISPLTCGLSSFPGLIVGIVGSALAAGPSALRSTPRYPHAYVCLLATGEVQLVPADSVDRLRWTRHGRRSLSCSQCNHRFDLGAAGESPDPIPCPECDERVWPSPAEE